VSDGHGDLVGGFDPAGSLQTLTDSAAFDPFGQAIASAGSKRSLGFQGDYTDPASGEVDMGARWYSPGTGGFTVRDSISLPSSPSGLANRYAYGLGAPTNFSDPDGHCPEGYTSYLYGADQRCVRNNSRIPDDRGWCRGLGGCAGDSRGDGGPSSDSTGDGAIPGPTVSDRVVAPRKNNTGGVGVYRPGPSPTDVARDASASAARNNPLPQVAAATVPIFAGPAGDSMSPPVSSSPDAPARQVSDNQVVDQQESIKRDVDKGTGGEPVIKTVGEPREAGFWEWVEHKVNSIDWAEVGHTILDVVGMIPVVGEIADGINAVWYLAEGDYLNAALSAAALVPFAGAAATGAKLIGKGLQKYGDEAAGLVSNCVRTNSFVAGTPVLMADGSTKPIEDVQFGDEVQATDPTTGETGPRTVTDLIVGTGEKELVQVTLDTDGVAGNKTDVVTATGGHSFWGSDKAVWRDARDLAPGDDVRTAEGLSLEVVGTTSRTAYLTVYNLTVDGLHTYYVLAGTRPILVHNTNCDPTVLYRSPGTGNRASEASGLNAANHAGNHPTAYLSNLPEGAAHYAGNGHDLGMHVFTMKPGFREAFGKLEFPLENSMGLTEGLTEWRIPASRFDEFNSYIDHSLTEWWDAADGHFFPPLGSIHSP
jgi:RHS repeat-associated protein